MLRWMIVVGLAVGAPARAEVGNICQLEVSVSGPWDVSPDTESPSAESIVVAVVRLASTGGGRLSLPTAVGRRVPAFRWRFDAEGELLTVHHRRPRWAGRGGGFTKTIRSHSLVGGEFVTPLGFAGAFYEFRCDLPVAAATRAD